MVLVIVVSALHSVPPVCSPWRWKGALQQVWCCQLRSSRWQWQASWAQPLLLFPSQRGGGGRGQIWLPLPASASLHLCSLLSLHLSVSLWLPISDFFYDSKLLCLFLFLISSVCVCFSGSASLCEFWSLSLTISFSLFPAPRSTCLAVGPDEWDHVSPCCPHILLYWTEGDQEELCAVSWLDGGHGRLSPLLGRD